MSATGKKMMLATAAMLAGSVLYTAPAAAQATRTWVSGVGDDVNPCSRTAPCKTFPGAISKTAAGGEINCLDPGGFGGVTVTKAMTFNCDTTEGGVLVTGQNAFTVNAGDADVVTISGIDMFGPTTGPGLNGVRFINGAGVNIRNSTIKGFGTQGVSFEVGAGDTSFLNMDNVILIGNGTNGDTSTGGIKIAPGTGATANVTLNNVRVSDTKNVGLRIDLTGTTGTRVNASVNSSAFTNSAVGVQLKAGAGTGIVDANVTSTVFSGNTSLGVFGNGTGVTGRFGLNVITGNGAGSAGTSTGVFAAAGSTLSSYGNNVLDGNFNNTATLANGAFSGTILPH